MNRFSGRDIWFILVLGLIYMFNFIDRTIISVLGQAIRNDLGLSDLQLGLLGGLTFSFFYAAMGIPLARLAERRNRVRIIAAVTTLWSIMTMLSGAAANFVQLLLARIGVGVGEAGFTPSLVSMIADRFDADKRATVFSLIAIGVAVGGALAALVGGALAEVYGWRTAFVVVGAPGLLLALVLLLTVPEPIRQDAGDAADTPSFGAVLRRVAASKSYVALTVGSGLVSLVGFGVQLFLIPLMVRRFGFDLREAGQIYAVSISLAIGLGSVFGGILTDRLSVRDVRWYGRAPAIAMLLALPLYLGAIYQDDWRWMAGLLFASSLCLYAFMPAIMTVTQRLVEPRMRASAAAIHSFGQTVFGLGAGSVLLGWMSDRLADSHYAGNYAADCLVGKGAVASPACVAASGTGLQQAMLLLGLALILALLAYIFATRSLPSDIAASEQPAKGK